MSEDRLAKVVEHTLLAATASGSDVDRLCDEAIEHGFGAVCVNPIWVTRCRSRLGSRGPHVVTVIGFPLGASHTEIKRLECARAVSHGADEIDMVMALWAFKSSDYVATVDDVRGVVQAAEGRPVKVILETGTLNDDEKRTAARLAVEGGASFVKTCTGFAPGQATVADIQLLRKAVGPTIGIKASGGIRDRGFAQELLLAGADRIGTSSGLALAARPRRKDG